MALVPHDSRWAMLYEMEADLIGDALGDLPFELDHIGSTAVRGLSAKPILDIALRVPKQHADRAAKALVDISYIERGYRSRRLFIRIENGNVRTHNLHLYEPDDPDCMDQLAFRDALHADPTLRSDYAELKRSLVERLGDAGRQDYAAAKTGFIRSVLGSAR